MSFKIVISNDFIVQNPDNGRSMKLRASHEFDSTIV